MIEQMRHEIMNEIVGIAGARLPHKLMVEISKVVSDSLFELRKRARLSQELAESGGGF
jgi:hypothetical protein